VYSFVSSICSVYCVQLCHFHMLCLLCTALSLPYALFTVYSFVTSYTGTVIDRYNLFYIHSSIIITYHIVNWKLFANFIIAIIPKFKILQTQKFQN